MEAWDAPEEHFAAYHEWTKDTYERILPPIREGCRRLLSLSEQKLVELAPPRLGDLLKEALDLECQAHVFYVSSSWPTSHYVELTETLLQSWMRFASPPPRVYSTPAEQLALELIQGTPTLTHARDAELQQIALGHGDLDGFICRWGYSYITRDEQLYFDRWRSWREDPQPLRQAIEQMQRATNQRLLVELLEESRGRAEVALSRTTQQLAAIDPDRYTQRVRLLTACMHFGRAHFRMKDDRDLVWSHTQAALRWIVLEVGRRLVAEGVVMKGDDLFLFTPQEFLGFLGHGRPLATVAFSAIAEQRRCDQKRLARYTLATAPSAMSPAPPEGGIMIGIPTGYGIAEGRAHIVRETTALADLAGLEEGDILVFLGEGKVGLTMFFPQIAGLVYSNGNGICHESNLCRELGKPAIVSLGENAYLIEEGEGLRIDAGKGTVTRLRSQDR
jgi:phosphohistidine swiveling domain-containing protein